MGHLGSNHIRTTQVKGAVWKCFLENYFFVFKKLFSKAVSKNSFHNLFLIAFMMFSNVFCVFYKTNENN